MARLQDFQNVTPTSSDKILIVQSQSQGLAPHTIKMDSANPTGTGKLSLNRKANTTEGSYSVAEGYNGTASGNYSHAEGNATSATGTASHAEGVSTTAAQEGSHAEGRYTSTEASGAHAEGYYSQAKGAYSHAEGYYAIAKHRSQHVFGEYNVADTSSATAGNRGNYVEIVGKGSNDANRSNARTLDWSGNEVLAGDLTINGGNKVTQYHDFAAQTSGTTVTYTIPSSLYTNGSIFILALKNQYGGGVYIVRCHGGNNKVSITPIVESPYATISEVSGHADQFSIASTSYIEPRITRIA